MANEEKKQKKVIFSEEIDNAITGYAVGLVFVAIGLFLLFEPTYFSEPIASYIIGATIGLFGVMGTGIELSKTAKIKGIDMLAIGATLFVGWLIQYVYIHTLWANIFFFAFLIFGVYGVFLGLFRAIYSIVENARQKTMDTTAHSKSTKIGTLISQIVLFLTQLCGLAVAIINVLKATGF